MEISIHFTAKTQTVEVIRNKLFNNEFYQRMTEHDILNHCFLTKEEAIKRNIPLDALNFLDEVCDPIDKEWFKEDGTLEERKVKMFDHIKAVNGVAVFVGDMFGGALDEYHMAISKAVNILIIQ